MAKQAHELRANPHQVSGDVEYLHCVNAQDERRRTHHSRAVGDLQSSAAANCISGADTSSMSHEDPGYLQPALKIKVQYCRLLENINHQGQFPVAGHEHQESDGVNADQCTQINKCSEQISDCLRIFNDDPEIHIETKDQEKESGLGKEGSSSGPKVSEEKDLAECVTPTAREQRISESNWVCPPPPMKKKPTSFKRIGRRPLPEYRRLLINPPDLHEFPDCIRALFDK